MNINHLYFKNLKNFDFLNFVKTCQIDNLNSVNFSKNLYHIHKTKLFNNIYNFNYLKSYIKISNITITLIKKLY